MPFIPWMWIFLTEKTASIVIIGLLIHGFEFILTYFLDFELSASVLRNNQKYIQDASFILNITTFWGMFIGLFEVLFVLPGLWFVVIWYVRDLFK